MVSTRGSRGTENVPKVAAVNRHRVWKDTSPETSGLLHRLALADDDERRPHASDSAGEPREPCKLLVDLVLPLRIQTGSDHGDEVKVRVDGGLATCPRAVPTWRLGDACCRRHGQRARVRGLLPGARWSPARMLPGSGPRPPASRRRCLHPTICSLTGEQAALYQAVVADMLDRIATTSGIERRGLVLATMTKLKQVCNHPAQFLRDRVSGVTPPDAGSAGTARAPPGPRCRCSRASHPLRPAPAAGHRPAATRRWPSPARPGRSRSRRCRRRR